MPSRRIRTDTMINLHLDLSSMKELPESHRWSPSRRDLPRKNVDNYRLRNASTASVPVIDLYDPNAMKLVGHACRTWGVFQVTNHCVSSSSLDAIESFGRSLFSLPLSQKLKTTRTPQGIAGYGMARISPFFRKLMWSEGFTIFGSPIDHARLLWPQDYMKFCAIIEQYQQEMKNLVQRLMWLILGSLGMTHEDIQWGGSNGDFEGACAAIQLNSYPPCPDPNRAMGLAAHTDSTLLTVLYQTNTSGLQVHREGFGWVTVPPIPGGLVIHVGDLLHILSNGSYPTVFHRAMVNRTQHRLSVAYLYGPPTYAKISPLPKLVDSRRPALYRSVTWAEYLRTKAKHFNKALSMLRL
ncbi:gibberellin 3-beta-dioxygenase 1-like [Impatiens glandulifera]|uniref:gibberellin 3-beta-dioxygenase 1-like n=1 Tax=Impatiens glandulifera TaxID=253017 RepID=UPI001FB1666C|nr:gibberellin 3-beta-dioxygenase 1-like [Impatiens glandulifera]